MRNAAASRERGRNKEREILPAFFVRAIFRYFSGGNVHCRDGMVQEIFVKRKRKRHVQYEKLLCKEGQTNV